MVLRMRRINVVSLMVLCCVFLVTATPAAAAAGTRPAARVAVGRPPSPHTTPPPVSGEIPWHAHQSIRLSADLSARIDLLDGHVDIHVNDLSIPARGPDLTLGHTWDSTLAQAGVSTAAGLGWRTDLVPHIAGILTATVTYTDVSGAQWPFVYSGDPYAPGPYTSYTTPNGLPWQLSTSTAGYTLTNILSGETLTFDAQNRYLAATDASGNSNTLSYNGANNAVSDSNSGARVLQAGYFGDGLLKEVQSLLWASTAGAQGQHLRYHYATGGYLTALTWGADTTDALTATFGYSGTQLVTITTPFTAATHNWQIGYDAQGRVSALTSPVSGTLGQAGYSPAATTQILYSSGQTQVVAGAGSSTPLTTTYTLDTQGEPTAIQDGLGNASHYTYDTDHDVLTSQDANGNLTTSYYQYVGPNGSTGLVTETVQPAIAAYAPVNSPSTVVTRHAYDPATNDLISTTLPEGGLAQYGYDGHHSVITTTELLAAGSWRGTVAHDDPYGEEVAFTDGRGVSVDSSGHATLNGQASQYRQTMSYDRGGDRTSVSTPPITTTLGGVTAVGPVTTTEGYDADGNRILHTTANGAMSGYAYDHRGRLAQSAGPGVPLWNGSAGLSNVGIITTVVGNGSPGCTSIPPTGPCYGGDGGPATQAELQYPYEAVQDPVGNLDVVDFANHRLRVVLARTGVISTAAGTGTADAAGDGLPAAQADLNFPYSVAQDATGNVFIADSGNNKVRQIVGSSGLMATEAGTGVAGFSGDGGPPTLAKLNSPRGVALDAGGNLYISDEGNNRVRLIDRTAHTIDTVAGGGTPCAGRTDGVGDGCPATQATLNGPRGVYVDTAGNVFIADSGHNRVREVLAATGIITTVAGTGTAGYNGDNILATQAQLSGARGVWVDGAGTLYIADTSNSRVRAVAAATGLITTVAGTGAFNFSGDGGPAVSAQLNSPTGVSVDGAGNLFIADYANMRIREVFGGAGVRPVATTGYDGDGNVVKQVDANGSVTTSSYDPQGRLVATTNPVSGTTLYTYTTTELSAQQDPVGNVTSYGYDAAGRQTLVTDPLSGTVQYGYDPAGNTTALTSGTPGAPVQTETRQYDALNAVVTDTLSGPTTPASSTVTSYDHDGNVFQVQQPNGDTVVNLYDRADQLTATQIYTPAINGPGGATGPSYDLYSHDAAGNVVLALDADGRQSTTTYDGDNRVVQQLDVTSAPTGTTTITTTPSYDPNGNTIAQTTQTADATSPGVVQTHTITDAYNSQDWVTSTSDDGLLTKYGYDAAGQARTQTIIDGVTPVTTTLDAEGRATAIAESAGGAGPYTSSFGYNPNDLPISSSVPGGVSAAAQYDADSRLSQLTASGPGGVANPLSSSYTYGDNPLGWTTAVTTTLNGVASTQLITHDAFGRVTAQSGGPDTPSSGAEQWQYDGNGNIIQTQEPMAGSTQDVTTVYTYSATQPNELTSMHTDGLGTEYHTYDQHGNTTSITSTDPLTTMYALSTSLSYDAQARPITITLRDHDPSIPTTTVALATVSFGYNALGDRSAYTTTTPGYPALNYSAHFQYRAGELAQASVVSGTAGGSLSYTDTYLYTQDGLPLELLRQQSGVTSRYWYVLDGRSNVVALTDSTGNVVDRYRYDLWGEATSVSETVPQQLRYAGYWSDAKLGWYWIGVRSYDPEGRWIQPDPSEADGVRTYVYVGDDPIDLIDPWGLCSGWTIWGACPWEGTGQVLGFVVHGTYQVLIGDDLDTLKERCSGLGCDAAKAWALADIALLVFPPEKLLKGGELAYKAIHAIVDAAHLHAHVSPGLVDKAVTFLTKGSDVALHCAACFPAGTLVATPQGEQQIQGLRVGDRVLAEDPSQGRVEAEAVQAVIADPVSPLVAIDLSDGSTITTTADHPFWAELGLHSGRGGWLEAGTLWAGIRLRTASGTNVLVVRVRRNVGRAAVYTLTVATHHTFFVGSAKVLVHNSNCDEAFLASLDNLSRKEIADQIDKQQTKLLADFFGQSIAGAKHRLQDLAIPPGLTRASLLRYKVIAQKAIAEGRDKRGLQVLRLELVERALKELGG